ncbi:MAG: hypothetical protein HOC05_08975 [Gemmatimonadetes bacterium]|nr:hypothetical protein [Gemmatimonadota bacterium]
MQESDSPQDSWQPFEAEAETIRRTYDHPLRALAHGEIPAFVLQGAHPPADCNRLIERFTDNGYFDRDTVGKESQLSGGPYLDLGTSLGRMGKEPAEFFAHADRTHTLFQRLFEGLADPVQTIYANLANLAGSKQVKTAYEEGGTYGPAIFRIYHGQEGHRAHFDSVRRRGKSSYAVGRFEHQFAGILCVQKGAVGGEPILYRAKAEGEVEEVLDAGDFAEYAKKEAIEQVQIELDAGDLYFFHTENVHEVPQVARDHTRVVLAVFIGMSEEDGEIFVWS